IDFALFSLSGDNPKHFEHIFHRFEMIPPIAQDVNDPDNSPILQFAQTIADIRAGDSKGLSDFVGRQRFFGNEKQGMDLSDGAIDPPSGPHFAPVEDELLGDWSEFLHIYLLVLSKQ